MSNSPFIPEKLRDYLTQFKIEEMVNRCVNDIARQMPSDPYSFIVSVFQKNASLDVQLVSVSAVEVFNSEMIPVLSIKIEARLMGKILTVYINPFGIANDQGLYLYDQDRLSGKGLNKGIQFIQEINSVISDKVCSQQGDIDSALLAAYDTKGNKGLYQINICSYAPSIVSARLLNKSLFQVYRQMFGTKQSTVKVCINCLQGSKVVGSKCKVYKYMLMCDDLSDTQSITNIVQSIRKTITTGKGGEAALKYSPDGIFICPVDTIMDNLKIVEQAINSNANSTKDKITVGISWMSDNFYNVEQKKYQLENPKVLLDTDQLIEYYFKLSNDKQSISYIEDPLWSEDAVGWAKILKRFQGSHVKVGSRKLFHNLESTKTNQQVSRQEKPQLNEAEVASLNQKKYRLQMHWYKPFELITLSNLVSIAKQLQRTQTSMILSQNLIETTDSTLVDLCYATCSYLNLSCPLKFNQIAKLNRVTQILKL